MVARMQKVHKAFGLWFYALIHHHLLCPVDLCTKMSKDLVHQRWLIHTVLHDGPAAICGGSVLPPKPRYQPYT